LREKVANGKITVNYVSTKEQVADSLTKALSNDNFKRFKAIVSVEDITEQLNTQGTQPLSEEEEEALEDLIEGREARFPELGL